MTRSTNLLSKLKGWMEAQITRPGRTLTLGLLATGVSVMIASHSVIAHPWGDHQPRAQAMVRAAACAGASEVLQGGGLKSAMVEAVAMAALKGFRKTHGSEIRVSPYYMDRRISSPTFGIRVTMTYKRAHFLLEAFTGNETPLVMETAVIDDASFHTCDNVMNRSGISTT